MLLLLLATSILLSVRPSSLLLSSLPACIALPSSSFLPSLPPYLFPILSLLLLSSDPFFPNCFLSLLLLHTILTQTLEYLLSYFISPPSLFWSSFFFLSLLFPLTSSLTHNTDWLAQTLEYKNSFQKCVESCKDESAKLMELGVGTTVCRYCKLVIQWLH